MSELRAPRAVKKIRTHHGCLDQPVHQIVCSLSGHQPELVWREPVPTRHRLKNFAGLWSPVIEPKADLPSTDVCLDEAKLFWRSSETTPWILIHLVSDMYGSSTATKSRWAVFWESAKNDCQPDWLKEWLQSVQPDNLEKPPKPFSCWSNSKHVLTLRDARRYGLPEDLIAKELAKLQVTEYFSGNELVLWHLGLPESVYQKT